MFPMESSLFHNSIIMRIHTRHELPVVLCPSVLNGSSETQPSYRLGDLDRIFLVGVSAPAGVTDRDMLDVVPRAFACSDIAQRNHFPALEFEAGYLVKRAPDGCL
jgi:hypothetical protein